MSFARQPRRFSHRVFGVFALSLLAVSAIFTASFLHVQRRGLEAALVDRVRGIGGLLATGARIAVYSENAAFVQETLSGVVDRRDVLAAAVFAADGGVVAAAGRSPALEAAAGRLDPVELALVERLRQEGGCLSRESPRAMDAFCAVVLRERGTTAEDLYFQDEPVAPGREYIGFVRVSIDRAPLRRELGRLVLRSLALMGVILLAGGWAGLHFSRRVTGPLERLTEAVRAFGHGGEIGDLSGMPEDETGRLARAFVAMTQDLAERERESQRLAERLRHAQKMEAVGALSQGISHDFKNILSTLKTAVHILQKGSPGNEFVQSYAGRMQTTLDRARDLVERLVAFSRTRELHLAPVDLAALLERLAPAFREVVGEHVRLNLQLPGAPVWVTGDAASLEQLLTNLVYNARDAMPEGGVLCVRLCVAAPAADGAATARLEVQDTGRGMGPEVRDRLFEPFFTTKGAGAGMGLGLSIVRGIVEEHRGAIRVESTPGEGTTFSVELPLAQGPAAAGGAS